MNEQISITGFDYFIFLGVFQGIFLSWFFIKNGKKESRANLYQGLLILFLALTIFEELLNNTGYIVQMLAITNFSEPLNFTFAPLLFLYIRNYTFPKQNKKNWLHFLPAIFWLAYMFFAFVQPDEIKYNSYVETKHPDWEYLHATSLISEDPIGIRTYINQMTLTQITVYLVWSIFILQKKVKELKQSLIKTDNELIIIVRNTIVHFIAITLIYLITKLYYGMSSDIGGYLIAAYISFMIFHTSYQVMSKSNYFANPQSFLSLPAIKYKKSTLDNKSKDLILEKIKHEMETQQYFLNNLASLSGLAKAINETTHNVSQVINEQMGKSFFELLAHYRIEEAKRIIQSDKEKKLTIEELSEQVGYNSRASFNTAFKKITNQTPSSYRNSTNN